MTWFTIGMLQVTQVCLRQYYITVIHRIYYYNSVILHRKQFLGVTSYLKTSKKRNGNKKKDIKRYYVQSIPIMGIGVSQLSRIFNNIIRITTKEHVVLSTNSHRPYSNRYIMSIEIVLFCWPVVRTSARQSYS